MGTENVNVAAIQRFFRRDSEDEFSGVSFTEDRLQLNQRIEAWWGRLRQGCADWWIECSKNLRDSGLYNDENVTH